MGNIGLKQICLNKFEAPRFADRALVEFAFFLALMYDLFNTAGIYTQRKLDLMAVLLPFNTIRKSLESKRASRGTATSAVYDFIDQFQLAIRAQYNLAVYALGGKDDARVKEIFHKGLSYFNSIPRDEIRTELDFLIDKGTKYATELGAGFASTFTTLKTQFTTLRDDQLDLIGGISSEVGDKNAKRLLLTKELTKQYLLFCSEHVDDDETVLNFFKFSYFTKHKKHHKNYDEYKGTVDAGKLLTVADDMKPTYKLILENKSSEIIKFGGGTDDLAPLTASIDVAANSTVEVLFSAISSSGDTKLKAFNTGTTEANYIVSVYAS
jgi:hypothetical protein